MKKYSVFNESERDIDEFLDTVEINESDTENSELNLSCNIAYRIINDVIDESFEEEPAKNQDPPRPQNIKL